MHRQQSGKKKMLSLFRQKDLTLPAVTSAFSLSNKLDICKVISHLDCVSPRDLISLFSIKQMFSEVQL